MLKNPRHAPDFGQRVLDIFKMEKNNLEIRESNISGKGVYAKKDIKKGDRICFMEGEIMDIHEMIKRVENDFEEGSDPLGVDDNMYMDLEEFYRCINHSCSPNAFIRGRNELVALRDINKNEEITFDYSTTMNDNLDREEQWTMECMCGSNNCRKIIDQFHLLPKEVQEFYIKNIFAPDFILRKFAPVVN